MIALDAVTPLSQIPEKPRKVIRMQTGGDPEKKLAEGPPENINMLPRFEGFEPGPNQFMLPEEETVIPSEPDVQPRTMDQRGELGPFVIPDKPMSSEPFFDTDMGTLRPEMSIEDRFFYGPVIRPQEVYPMDPDPGIMGILPNPNMPMRNMPQLLEANLQNVGNNGIMNFNLDLIKKLNYEKPFGSYNV